jgi:hypothetical protein
MLQRSLFPWVEIQDEKEREPHVDSADGATTTTYEVSCHYGVPEVLFEEYLNKEMEEMESCWSLPFTLLLVAAYIGMMICHNDAKTVYAIESTLERQVVERARFGFTSPYKGWKNIDDISSIADVYSWLHKGLIPLIMEGWHDPWEDTEPDIVDWSWEGFTTLPPNTSTNTTTPSTTTTTTTLSTTTTETSTTTTNTTTSTTTHLALDPTYLPFFNRLAGGLRFSQELSIEGAKCSGPDAYDRLYGKECAGGKRYELNPDSLSASQTKKPKRIRWLWVQDNVTTIKDELIDWEYTKWLDDRTVKLEIAIPSYNGEFGVHTLLTINFFFNRGGRIWKKIIPESIFAEQYPNNDVVQYMFDFTWMFCVLYIIYTESRKVWRLTRKLGWSNRVS